MHWDGERMVSGIEVPNLRLGADVRTVLAPRFLRVMEPLEGSRGGPPAVTGGHIACGQPRAGSIDSTVCSALLDMRSEMW